MDGWSGAALQEQRKVSSYFWRKSGATNTTRGVLWDDTTNGK